MCVQVINYVHSKFFPPRLVSSVAATHKQQNTKPTNSKIQKIESIDNLLELLFYFAKLNTSILLIPVNFCYRILL